MEEARSFPGFGNTAMIDRDAAFDVIDQMRQTIPEELKQARWIVKERQAMLDEARSESDRIIRAAQEEAEKITSEEEVIKRAEKRSAEIMEEARRREREIRLGAEDYADEVLANLEDNLARLLEAVQRGRSKLQGVPEEENKGMNKLVKLKRPGMGIGDSRELSVSLDLSSFDLYGRRHEVKAAEAYIQLTRLTEGLHLDFEVTCDVATTCDRTLEPTEITLRFGESEFLSGPNDPELYVEDWELNITRYAQEALPSEIPMQVFCPGTKPVTPVDKDDNIDPRWRGLGDFFAANF